jgi:hypothetical protein
MVLPLRRITTELEEVAAAVTGGDMSAAAVVSSPLPAPGRAYRQLPPPRRPPGRRPGYDLNRAALAQLQPGGAKGPAPDSPDGPPAARFRCRGQRAIPSMGGGRRDPGPERIERNALAIGRPSLFEFDFRQDFLRGVAISVSRAARAPVARILTAESVGGKDQCPAAVGCCGQTPIQWGHSSQRSPGHRSTMHTRRICVAGTRSAPVEESCVSHGVPR